ncbi:MAG: hypothetical protein ACOZFS_15045 [Thermodesulfobacteriota bacterium]
MFKLIEVERFEKEFNINLNGQSLKKERKKTKLQIAREKVREKAGELWSKNESIPIADMVVRDDITQITENVCGDMFAEKTLRDWIKDLCPNRKPGRRPKSTRSTRKTES